VGYEIAEQNVFCSGHSACPGCNAALAVRYIVNTLGHDTIAVVPPSCVAIIVGSQPLSSLKIPVYHTTLESSAASAAGIKRALKARGRGEVNVVAIAGDGGTYDIGFQALSSAAERNEDIIYVCLDNEGYMNTGAQKSSATPYLAYTTSTPAGKPSAKKNLAEIMGMHRIPYVATATTGYPDDLVRKVRKARDVQGMRFILVLTPCLDGWGLGDHEGVKVSRLAVTSGIFPLYEIEDGERYTLNYGCTGTPAAAYLSRQKRYRHLSQVQIDEIQDKVNSDWQRLRKKFEV